MDITNAISIARLTDVGRVRKRNEDAVASDLTTGLVMVADGMGGYNGGEIASEMAAITVTAELAEMLYQQSLLKKKSLTVSAMSLVFFTTIKSQLGISGTPAYTVCEKITWSS